MSKVTFSDQQLAVFNWVENGRGNAFVEAVAGAGKTFTLLEACGRTSGTVAFAAYNKAIATEIQEKLAVKNLGKRVRAGTFHSFGFSAWRQVAPNVKVDAWQKKKTLQDRLPMLPHLADIVSDMVSYAKQRAMTMTTMYNRNEWFNIVDHFNIEDKLEDDDDIEEVITLAQKALQIHYDLRHTIIDFDDMIWLPVVTGCRVWQNDWLFVDEAQDTNPCRRALARKMLKPGGRAIFVGDRHQAIYGFCHPAGTLVKTPNGEIPIETIVEGDPVIVSDTQGNIYGRKRNYPVLKTHKYYHSGSLITLQVGDKKVEMTPHHKVPVRISNNHEYYTYMMRRNGVYRVGYCKAFTNNGFMLTHRCRTEKADAMWILGSHKTKREAIEAETRLLMRVKGRTFSNMSDEQVEGLQKDDIEAVKILSEHGRMVDFPLLMPGKNKHRFSRKGPFVTEACNILDGMEAAFYSKEQEIGGKKGKTQKFVWTPITITQRHFSGYVYGITVKPAPVNETYTQWPLYFAGDGILVHNTGADNDSVDQIVKSFSCTQLPLTTTYRCPKNVVAEAKTYVNHINAHDSAPEGLVRSIVQDEIFNQNLCKTDVILCRNTQPIITLAYQLIRKGIGCHVEGRDIGKGLKTLLKKWKVKNVAPFLDRLQIWTDRQVEILNSKGRETQAEALKDRTESLRVLCEGCLTIGQVEEKIDKLFVDTDEKTQKTLILSTVHKAKGREWNRVFILGMNKYMPSKWARSQWQKDQETNLIYVAQTRAKQELVYVNV